jgi:DGQHR domain-containing protein
MTLSNLVNVSEGEEPILFREIARVLDGQHRLEGLDGYKGDIFEINVAVFISIDISEQANIFSTVNLAQTKVKKSLAYDLFALARSRSPQKSCHNIAVALDQNEKSPFFQRIKRLGVATEGRFNETITQATFVETLLPYLSPDAQKDRDIFKRGGKPELATAEMLQTNIFRNMFLAEKDMEIADIVWNLFDAVRDRWPGAWNSFGRGNMLNKTNGFRAFMRFLKPAYLYLTGPGEVVSKAGFMSILQRVSLQDSDFNIEKFIPGSSGETDLYRTLLREGRVEVNS